MLSVHCSSSGLQHDMTRQACTVIKIKTQGWNWGPRAWHPGPAGIQAGPRRHLRAEPGLMWGSGGTRSSLALGVLVQAHTMQDWGLRCPRSCCLSAGAMLVSQRPPCSHDPPLNRPQGLMLLQPWGAPKIPMQSSLLLPQLQGRQQGPMPCPPASHQMAVLSPGAKFPLLEGLELNNA